MADWDTYTEFSSSSQSAAFIRPLKTHRIKETNNYQQLRPSTRIYNALNMAHIHWATYVTWVFSKCVNTIRSRHPFRPQKPIETLRSFATSPKTCRWPGWFVLMHGLILKLSALLFLLFEKIYLYSEEERRQIRQDSLLTSDGSICLILFSCACQSPLFKEFNATYFFHVVCDNLGSPQTIKNLSRKERGGKWNYSWLLIRWKNDYHYHILDIKRSSIP